MFPSTPYGVATSLATPGVYDTHAHASHTHTFVRANEGNLDKEVKKKNGKKDEVVTRLVFVE